MGISTFLRKRKMRKDFVKKGLISPGPSLGFRFRESKIGKSQKKAFDFIEEILPAQKGKRRKSRKPFGKIKDKSLGEGGFF